MSATPLPGDEPTPLRRRLQRYYRIDDADGCRLDQVEHEHKVLERGADIIANGARNDRFIALQTGWGYRYTVTRDGARQILNFLLPGDIVNPDGVAVVRTDHGSRALTEVTLRIIEKDAMGRLLRRCPGIIAGLWWSNAQEKGMLQAQIVRIGRQNALQRIGHLLLELHRRLLLIDGLDEPNSFVLPLTQREIGDALGLTSVHVSRVLTELRKAQLLRLSTNQVVLLKSSELADLCDYDSRHLHLDSQLADSLWSSVE